jgi:ribosomal protein S18 acetylase RimI-like enzyme
MDVSIRPYRESDRAQVTALLQEHGWASRFVEGQLRAAANLALSDNGATLVAATAGLFAGFVSVEIHGWNSLAQLRGLAVSRSVLRHGVGASLVEAAERIARDRGCRGIYVDTPLDNERGRAFYLARGYVEDYRMSRYYADDIDGVTYAKFFT